VRRHPFGQDVAIQRSLVMHGDPKAMSTNRLLRANADEARSLPSTRAVAGRNMPATQAIASQAAASVPTSIAVAV
jgi:hypothetical protein